MRSAGHRQSVVERKRPPRLVGDLEAAAQLGLEANDSGSTVIALGEIEKRIAKDSLRNSAELGQA